MNYMYDDNICPYCGTQVVENNVVLVATQMLSAFEYLQNCIMILLFYAIFSLAYHLPSISHGLVFISSDLGVGCSLLAASERFVYKRLVRIYKRLR